MLDEDARYENDITGFRQPMVTSIGIILGFLLTFLANWAIADDTDRALQTSADWVVASTLLISIALMVSVLARLLDNRIKPGSAGARYQLTFRLYIGAITLGLFGLAASLVI